MLHRIESIDTELSKRGLKGLVHTTPYDAVVSAQTSDFLDELDAKAGAERLGAEAAAEDRRPQGGGGEPSGLEYHEHGGDAAHEIRHLWQTGNIKSSEELRLPAVVGAGRFSSMQVPPLPPPGDTRYSACMAYLTVRGVVCLLNVTAGGWRGKRAVRKWAGGERGSSYGAASEQRAA